METVDRIKRRFPKGITLAVAGFDKGWKPKAERISRRYTTNWGELVCVNRNDPWANNQ
jgi:DNA polymerase V